MTLHLKAEAEDAGTRLDAFVASRANGLTRSQAARYIEEGRVSVDGKPAAKSCRITGGEAVTVDVPEVRDTALTAQDIPLDVVYEDADVIVVNKPAGLVVHPAPGHPDGQRPAPPLRVVAVRHRRGEASRHRSPHRPGHQRSHHRRQERRRPSGAQRPAQRPHAGADV